MAPRHDVNFDGRHVRAGSAPRSELAAGCSTAQQQKHAVQGRGCSEGRGRETTSLALYTTYPTSLAELAVQAAGCAMGQRRYDNTLTPIEPRPLLSSWPQFVQPVVCRAHFEAPMLVDDGEEAEISVRAWRWSYNGVLL